MSDYQILRGHAEALAPLVKAAIADGWEPLGGPVCTGIMEVAPSVAPDGYESLAVDGMWLGYQLAQAMTRREP